MEVKDVLPASGPVRLGQIEPVRRKPLVEEVSDLFGHQHHRDQVRLGDLPEVGSVPAGHY